MKQNESLCKKKFKSFLLVACLAWIIAVILQLSDSIIAGQFLGEESVAAIGIITPVYGISVFISDLIAIGTSILYVSYMGKFKNHTAYQYFSEGLITSIVSGIVIALILLIFKNNFIDYFCDSEHLKQLCLDYFTYYIVIFSLQPLYNLLDFLVYNDGNEKICLISILFSIFCNILFSILLVQQYGIKGIAIGTIIGFFIGFFILLSHLFTKKSSLKFVWSFNLKHIIKIFKFSLADSSFYIYHSISLMVLNKYVLMVLGETYLPMLTIMSFALELEIIFGGIGESIEPLANVYIAEKNTQRQKYIAKLGVWTSLIFGVSLAAFLLITSNYIPAVFNITTKEVFETSIICIRLIAIGSIFVSFIMYFSSYYTIKNHVFIGLTINGLRTMIFPILLCIIFTNIIGPIGIGLGYLISSILALSIMMLYVYIKYGKSLFPYLIEKSQCQIYNYNLVLNEKNIIDVSRNISKVSSDMASMIVEETCMAILDYNTKNNILMEISVYVDNDKIQIIMWDNGVVFDITKIDIQLKNFRTFFVDSLMNYNKNKIHQTLVGFNRNAFKINK